VFPTLAEMTGIATPEGLDGISFLPTLLGKDQPKHDFLYWEFHEKGGRQALRKGEWKLVSYYVFDPAKTTLELYNITNDPGEQNDVAGQHPAVVKELSALMAGARTHSEIFSFQPSINVK
jgi:arylsulfatase A-like enzyme